MLKVCLNLGSLLSKMETPTPSLSNSYLMVWWWGSSLRKTVRWLRLAL